MYRKRVKIARLLLAPSLQRKGIHISAHYEIFILRSKIMHFLMLFQLFALFSAQYETVHSRSYYSPPLGEGHYFPMIAFAHKTFHPVLPAWIFLTSTQEQDSPDISESLHQTMQ